MTIPRYRPDEGFPAYAHVPGRSPHPISDPRGHSYRRESAAVSVPGECEAVASPSLLRGADLFNHGYYWEAHEVWEALWLACGRSGTVADFVKGLIKLAAAGVKAREGRPAGVRRHAQRAGELFRTTAHATGAATFLGLDLQGLIAAADNIAADPPVDRDPRPEARPVFSFQLLVDLDAQP